MTSSYNDFPFIIWTYPSISCVKLNCEELVFYVRWLTTCGGVIRDNNGDFIVDFTSNLCTCTIAHEELQIILLGLSVLEWKT